MMTFNEKLKSDADKRKQKMRDKFAKARERNPRMTITEFADRYYPNMCRQNVNRLLVIKDD